MAHRPDPPSGPMHANEDFTFLNSFNGRRGINMFTDGDVASDVAWRRNDRTCYEQDLIDGYGTID